MLHSNLSKSGVLNLTIANAPANTLSEHVLDAFLRIFSSLDDQVRVVVLGSEGHIFCAGHDLKELSARRNTPDCGHDYFTLIMQKCAKVMQAIVNARVPVICKVSGLATAAGCQLVASCDLALASEDASFCTPGVNIGLFCSTPMVALSRNLTRKHAMEMLLLGRQIDAEKALSFGLINRVVSQCDLDHHAQEMAETIASKSAYTLAIGKSAFHQQIDMSLADAYDWCTAVMVKNMMARDAEEGIGAVLEKRTPSWQDC